MKKFVILFTLLLVTTLVAQQTPQRNAGSNASALLQQALAAVAGMQADINLLKDDTTKLRARIETLEQDLADRDQKIARLESLCAAQATQMQTQEKQWNEKIATLQNTMAAMEKDRQNLQKQFQQFSKDLSKDLAAVAKSSQQTPQKTKNTYTGPTRDFKVESGDTLGSIAKALGCTVQDLVDLNNLSSKDAIIRVGQILKVPSK